MAYILGVDVGTTYTAAAIDVNGQTEIFQLGSHAASIPSVVLLRDDGEVLTGDAAERRAQTEPARTAREFKRRLGDPVPVILGGTPYGAEALYAYLLRSVVARVTEQRGEAPGLVVITHPASYGPYKLDLLRQAVRQAGIHDVAFLSEPEAAAIHYASQERVEPGIVVAVYDFGGGTFDAAVLRKTKFGFELLGESEGLERLGGIDFDQAILAFVNAATKGALDTLDRDDATGRAAASRLRDECRQTKEALSSDTEGVIPVLLPNIQTEVRLTREEFEEAVRPRLRETIAALERSVRSTGLTLQEVDRILLVGGSSRIPLVSAMIREATGRLTALDAHPKHAIALGAAIHGRQHLARPERIEPGLVPLSGSPGEVGISELQPVVAPAPVAMPLIGSTSRPAPSRIRGLHGSRSRLLALGGLAAAAVVAGGALATYGLSGGAAQGNAGDGDRAGTGSKPAPTQSTAAAVFGATAAWTPTASPATSSPSGTAAVVTATRAVTAATQVSTPASPASPAPTVTATATYAATAQPVSVNITAIKVSGDRYEVNFATMGFTPTQNGRHVHFYFNTASPESGTEHSGTSPFTGYTVVSKPPGAQQMCVVAVQPEHSVIAGSGSCMNLPASSGY